MFGAWPPDISTICISDLLMIRFSLAPGLNALSAHVVLFFHLLSLLLWSSNTQITFWQFFSWLCCQWTAKDFGLKRQAQTDGTADAALQIRA